MLRRSTMGRAARALMMSAMAAAPAAPALAHAFTDKTIRLIYGGTMRRCVVSGPCVTLPFRQEPDTIYLTEDKVFDAALDKSGEGVDFNQRHEVSVGGGRRMFVTYAVLGQKFLTAYEFPDDGGAILSRVTIVVTGRGAGCSVDYKQEQPGYVFSPSIALRQCSIKPGKAAP